MGRSIIAFCAGAAIGSLVTYLFTKENADEIREQERESVKRAYGFYDQNDNDIQSGGEVVSDEEASMYRKINKTRSYDGYDKYYNGGADLDLRGNYFNDSLVSADFPTQTAAESEHPTDEDNKQPYVISLEEYEKDDTVYDEDGEAFHTKIFDKINLTYYEGDDTLILDQNGDVLNIEETVGNDALNRFGEYEKDTVYVRNENLGADYEVVREHGSYSKEVLGFDD